MRRWLSLAFASVLFLTAWLGAPASAPAGPDNVTVTLPSVTRETTLVVTGSAPPGAKVRSDHSAATVLANANGLYFLPLSLSEGENTILIQADLDDSAFSVTKKVMVNPKAPPLDVRVPRATNLSVVDFEGFTQPGVRVAVNSRLVPVDEHGRFTARAQAVGENGPDLVILATDSDGNQSEYRTRVRWRLDTPITYKAKEWLRFDMNPGDKVTVEYSQSFFDARTSLGELAPSDTLQVSTSVPVQFGTNLFWFDVTTPEGATYTELLSFDKPVDVSMPYHTNVSDVPITGRMRQGAKLAINDAPVTPDQDGNFTYTLHLKPGTQSVKVRVENGTNSYEYLERVSRFALYPPVTSSTLRFHGEEPGSTFLLGGQRYTVDAKGEVVLPLSLLPGENDVVLPLIGSYGEQRFNLFHMTYYPGTKVIMMIGSDQATVGAATQTMPVPPQLLNGSTYVPLRYLADVLGAALDWDAATGIATYTRGDHAIKITIGDANAIVDGTSVAMSAPAQMVNGRTMVPLRFVSENLGVPLYWDGATSTIILYIPQP